MYDQYKLVLATDLDGTFLEGNHQVKRDFYSELLRLREIILLIYVTGRSIDAVQHFCVNGYLPHPHYIIGDHGTHIVDGLNFLPVESLQNPICLKWNGSNDFLKQLLKDDVGIQLQPIDPPYRVAYYYCPQLFQEETVQKIVTSGFDVIQSCDMYLDIVPRGVNKGSSLLGILEHLNLNPEAVVTCGDSLNDLSLFQTGLKSVAVGNSEPKLLSKTKELNNVYHSSFPGLLGVIDGLHYYDKAELFNKLPLNKSIANVKTET